MDILLESERCSAQQVLSKLPDPPSYSAVRALLARLVDKGHVGFERQGVKHIYFPLISGKKARGSALARLVKTFFKGSKSEAVTALLDMNGADLSPREIEEIERKIALLKSKKDRKE